MDPNIQPKFAAQEGEPRPIGREHSALEKDIERLSKEIRERKAAKPELPEREVLKSALGARIQPQKPAAPPGAGQAEPDVLPSYLQKEPAEIKLEVEKLINVAFHKGIDVSIKEAKKCGPFILDAFHDALTAKLYEELKKRKII